MDEAPTPVSGSGALTEEIVCTELGKVLTSASFQSSERLAKFLRFVVERTLAGEADQLKEYRIGVEVFGRPPSYDPRVDPVVRVEARRLRARLAQYYEKEGLGGAIRIDIPKGSYAAAFAASPAPEATRVETSRPTSDGRINGFPSRPSPVLRRHWSVSAALLLLLVLVIAVGALYWRRFRLSSSSEPLSLAVLPFLNLTGNPDNEYLSDGLTDELTSALANAPGLRVVARTSAFKFKDKSEDVREIGKRLNVSSLLEGSIQAQGGRLRITAQLIRTSDGFHVWSQTYDRPFEDSFMLEDDISRALSAALSLQLSAEAEANARAHNIDATTHELYLRGRYLAQRPSEQNAWKSINYFNQALDRDPLYAQAYAGLAGAYAVLGSNAWAVPDEVYPKALAAAKRAVELDDSLGEAHERIANITFMYNWRPRDAEPEFQRAIELNPSNVAARQHYGIMLHYTGRFDEALRQFKLAKQADPLAWQIDMTTVLVYESQRNYGAAIDLDREILGSNSNQPFPHAVLGCLYADQGQYPQAIEEVKKAIDLGGNDADVSLLLGQIYAQSGRHDQAVGVLQQVLARKTGFIPPYTVAAVYARLGDKDRMYEWLDKAVEQHSPACLKLQITPAFSAYGSEPRFQAILRKIGLSQ